MAVWGVLLMISALDSHNILKFPGWCTWEVPKEPAHQENPGAPWCTFSNEKKCKLYRCEQVSPEGILKPSP